MTWVFFVSGPQQPEPFEEIHIASDRTRIAS